MRREAQLIHYSEAARMGSRALFSPTSAHGQTYAHPPNFFFSMICIGILHFHIPTRKKKKGKVNLALDASGKKHEL